MLVLDDRGLLPPGVHDASLDDVEQAFGRLERSRQSADMILNDEELKLVQKQLGRVQRALDSLREDIKSDSQFAVLSEGYVDQIAELQAEIDAYAKQNGKGRKAS